MAQLPLVYDQENTGVNCESPPLPAPNELSNYPLLPDPFAWADGSGRVSNFDDWECRRNEIKAEIEHYEIGTRPPKPVDISATFSNNTLTVSVTENGKTLTLSSNVVVPSGEGPFPIIIGMNSPTGSLPSSLFEGVIQVPFMHNQVTTYYDYKNSDPFFELYPDQNVNNTGQYAAWSWGVSRIIDGIELVSSEMNADLNHIAVSGCSYAGKMALFSGAFDERIALTIVQESGGGGINSWRVSETIGDVEKLGNTNYDWFRDDLRNDFNGKVGYLPHDHHELMAMVVPRAMLVLGNPPFVWLGDESGYVSCRAVQEVYKEFEIEDRFGFSFRSGHDHCSLPSDSYAEVTAFVDKFLFEDEAANTNIEVHEFQNVDYNYWIEAWKTPANPITPSVSIALSPDQNEFQAPATIEINATVTDQNNDVTKVEFYSGQEKINEDQDAPYSMTLIDLSPGKYSISAVVIDAEGLKGYSNIVEISVIRPDVTVNYISTPSIDGFAEDIWNHESIQLLSAENTLVGNGLNPQDLSGTAKMIWDNSNIYLLAEITDDSFQNDGPATYEDDNVEFYFDTNNSKGASYDADDVQFSFAWNDGDNVGVLPSGRSSEGINYVIAENSSGYLLEAAVPWNTIQAIPAEGMKIGFEFMINDDDDGGSRDAKLSWNATEDQAWQNASLFGTIVLKGNPPAEVLGTLKDENTGISVYPNPAHDILKVEGFSKEFNYQIRDLNGKTIMKGDTTNAISIGGLKSGIYLLEIISDSVQTEFKFLKD